MPRGDGTGPQGRGSMTGRAAGYCAGYAAPGFANPEPGRGMGFGMGRGLGPGFRGGRGGGGRSAAPCGPPAPSAQQEMAALRAQTEYFENALDSIKKRVSEIEGPEAQK